MSATLETITILRNYVKRLEHEYYDLMDSKALFEVRADGMADFKKRKRLLSMEITKGRELIVYHSKKLQDEANGK